MDKIVISSLIKLTMNCTNISKIISVEKVVTQNLPHRKVETSKGWPLWASDLSWLYNYHIF